MTGALRVDGATGRGYLTASGYTVGAVCDGAYAGQPSSLDVSLPSVGITAAGAIDAVGTAVLLGTSGCGFAGQVRVIGNVGSRIDVVPMGGSSISARFVSRPLAGSYTVAGVVQAA